MSIPYLVPFIVSLILLIDNIISYFFSVLGFIFSPHLGHMHSLSSFLNTNIFIIFLSLSNEFDCWLKFKVKFNWFPPYKNISEFIFLSILFTYFWHISFIGYCFEHWIVTFTPSKLNITFASVISFIWKKSIDKIYIFFY